MTGIELTAVAGFVTAIVGAFAVLYKVKPDRDSLVITQAQGAATILNDLVDTLRAEVVRERELRREAHARANEGLLRIAELEAENEGLKRRYGTRDDDAP